MQILIVDDDPNSVLPLELELDQRGHRHMLVGFEQMKAALNEVRPDLVVLDLRDDGAGGGNAGTDLYETAVWKDHFCPVVVYSGFADEFHPKDQSLVKTVEKKDGSEVAVLAAMDELRPYSDSLSGLRNEIDGHARETLRDLTRAIANQAALTPAQIQELVVGMGRRRTAAYLDDQKQAAPLMPESQYVFPPTSAAYRFGDVLRLDAGPANDAASFRLVLSPSCDLEPQPGKPPRVNRVLVAHCCTALGRGGLPEQYGASFRKSVLKVLSAGCAREFVLLPAFLGLVPAMCADLKSVDLLEGYADTGGGVYAVAGYSRVVSIDSPFRERIAWAFMNVAVRPGVPGLDNERWADMYA